MSFLNQGTSSKRICATMDRAIVTTLRRGVLCFIPKFTGQCLDGAWLSSMKLGTYRTKLSGFCYLSIMSFANSFSTSGWVISLRVVTCCRVRTARYSRWHPLSTAISFPTLTSVDGKSSGSTTAIRLSDSNLEIDAEGRLIRKTARSGENKNGWDTFDPLRQKSSTVSEPQRRYGRGGWVDDYEGWDITGSGATPRPKLSSNRRASPSNNRRLTRRRLDSSDRRHNQNDRWIRPSSRKSDSSSEEYNKINFRNLDLAGFDHLYGLSSVLNALQANVRSFANPANVFLEPDKGDEATGMDDTALPLKPEAQLRPYLFALDPRNGSSGSHRSSDKQIQANKILHLAEQYNIPIAYVDKGVLNTLSNNRPHQGFVLRCGKLNFNDRTISKIPIERDDTENYKSFWLVLDEVVDPQNLGAILRTAFFLGGGTSSSVNLGVLICQKNSAPPSAAVSSASAGALEILMQSGAIYSSNNLMRTLSTAEQDGCRIVGASSSVPFDSTDVPLYDLQNLPVVLKHSKEGDNSQNRPTLLVLGSEGHGLRSLVAKCCTEFVHIPPGNVKLEETTDPGNEKNTVDSLNVSVTAGILLWHFAQHLGRQNNK
jgi:21S rRNA (GM2251-2'-O)-methyltransferase